MSEREFFPPWFYQGPYVPSGVIYVSGGYLCQWLIPGFDPDTWTIDVYSPPTRTPKRGVK